MRRWLLPLLVAPCIASAQPTFSHPDRIRYDGHCFTIDGKDAFIFSGAFHYFRCPKELWRARFKKIKEAGFNAVETYVAWNWSERKPPSGLNDDSGIDLTDLDAWLSMAEDEFGLYTIVRPGPYICSEWASGGYPNWLQKFRPEHTKRSVWYRTDDPVFEQWSAHWFKAVAKVVAKHQLTRKPKGSHGVILWQVENEYDFSGLSDEIKRNYVDFLIDTSQKSGIDVPIFTCWTSPVRDPKGDPLLKQAFDNPNSYPRWNIKEVGSEVDEQHKSQPYAPKMVTEFQGGWFGGVGGEAAEEQKGISAAQCRAMTLYAISQGLTGLNYYMLFGGTNFGDWAAEGITTCYDYYAPIREWGGTGEKYRDVQAIGRMLEKYGPDLARSEPVKDVVFNQSFQTDKELQKLFVGARAGHSGAVYYFFWNQSRTASAKLAAHNLKGFNTTFPPFGANVFRLQPNKEGGEWLVQSDAPKREELPASIRIKDAEVADLTPTNWRQATNPSTTGVGIWDSRFIAYRAKPSDSYMWLQSKGCALAASQTSLPGQIQHGTVWKSGGSPVEMVMLNNGWPNGGEGMEEPHGITAALTASDMPQPVSISPWKMKMLTDQSDRSLAAAGVDTAGWHEGVDNDLFLPHTTGVLHATFNLSGPPDPKMKFECGGVDDEGWFYVNGHMIGEVHHWDVPVSLVAGSYLKQGLNEIAIVIQNNDGGGGLTGDVAIESPLPDAEPVPIEWTDSFQEGSYSPMPLDMSAEIRDNEHPQVGVRPPGPPTLVRSRIQFDRPPGNGPWEILLESGGDGFLTLNGKPLGRYWEVGPQRGFYLPEPWLQAHNVLEITTVRGSLGDRLKAAELKPLPMQE